MNGKVNYALVGLFVVVTIGAGLGFGLWLAATADPDEHESYVTYMRESVSGLNPKAPVKYRGVDVGQVADIALDPDDPTRVRLMLEVRSGTPIKEDNIAVLSSQGITGLAYIELTGGTRQSPALVPRAKEPYAEIKSGPSLLVRMDTAVTGLIAELKSVATNTGTAVERMNLLLDSQNLEATSSILESLRDLTRSLTANVDALSRNFDDLSQISRNAATASEQMPTLIVRVGDSLSALEKTAGAVADAAGAVDRLAGASRKGLDEVSRTTLPQLGQLLAEVKQLAESLRRLSQDLERNPNMLLYGRGGRRGPGE